MNNGVYANVTENDHRDSEGIVQIVQHETGGRIISLKQIDYVV